ncbi:MAG: hypothetical protein Q4D04_14710, partial [Clostridia bacterium]|nr:hypothetical protein [Clostridia bacterium]
TEYKLRRDFNETSEARVVYSSSDGASAMDPSGYGAVNTLIDSLLLAMQSVRAHPSGVSGGANTGAFEWLSTDFDGGGITALDGVKRVAVAPVAARLNVVSNFYDVITPEWMIE